MASSFLLHARVLALLCLGATCLAACKTETPQRADAMLRRRDAGPHVELIDSGIRGETGPVGPMVILPDAGPPTDSGPFIPACGWTGSTFACGTMAASPPGAVGVTCVDMSCTKASSTMCGNVSCNYRTEVLTSCAFVGGMCSCTMRDCRTR
jgi:hypothetical protein